MPLDFVLPELATIMIARNRHLCNMKTKDGIMEYLTLNNGIRMPLIGFGTFMLGGGTCTEAVSAAIETAAG